MQSSRSYIPANEQKWVIELNPAFASTSTQEYMGAAIVHELIHSFITLYQDYRPANVKLNDLDQHALMLDSWINNFSNIMVEAFGLNANDAFALACSGLMDVLTNSEGVPIADADNFVKKKYNKSISDIKKVSYEYENKIKGTKCH